MTGGNGDGAVNVGLLLLGGVLAAGRALDWAGVVQSTRAGEGFCAMQLALHAYPRRHQQEQSSMKMQLMLPLLDVNGCTHDRHAITMRAPDSLPAALLIS